MTRHTLDYQDQMQVLNQIHEGMSVYDSDDKEIGSVGAVYFGANGDREIAGGTIPATTSPVAERGGDSFLADLASVFDPEDEVPEEMAKQLRYNGYIKIDGGWFGTDRYVMPDQIASVTEDAVHLAINRDYLVTE